MATRAAGSGVGDFTGFTHVIFDLDGVLLDTEPLYTRATEQIVAPFGKVFDWSVKARLMGRDALTSARTLVNALDLPMTPQEYLDRQAPVLDALLREAAEIPGAADLVDALRRRGLRLAVATSSTTPRFRMKTAHHEWFDRFDVVVCSDDPRVKQPKPAPDIFLVAREALGARAETCLVIEDSLAGVASALAAGMQVLALADARLPESAFRGARRVLRSYSELDMRP
jgi:pseudouridine-5'-monophosphatase